MSFEFSATVTQPAALVTMRTTMTTAMLLGPLMLGLASGMRPILKLAPAGNTTTIGLTAHTMFSMIPMALPGRLRPFCFCTRHPLPRQRCKQYEFQPQHAGQ